MRKALFLTASLLALTVAPTVAQAAWPDDRPIELVVGFAPGGGTDAMARALGRFMEKRLGPQARIVIVNKPGAGGELAAAHVAQSRPDGYTLGMINVPGFVFLPLYRKTTYQPAQLRLVARLVDDPAILVAKTDGNAPKSLAALIQAAREQNKGFSVGHSGEGTTGHLAMLMLAKQAGIELVSVPFKGSGDSRLALLGGHVDYLAITTGEATDVGQPGSKYTGVVLWSAKRTVEGVATTKEAGFDIRMSSERGVGGPKGLPDAIVKRLQDAIVETFKDPAFLEAARQDVPVLAYLPGEEWERALDESRPALQALVPLMSAGK